MIYIKNKNEIKIIRAGGIILAGITEKISKMAKPGISTADLENEALRFIEAAGGRPAFKDYAMPNGRLFPSALCTSINDEVVHAPAFPGRILIDGDILKIDVGMEYPIVGSRRFKNPYSALGGYYTDMAVTIGIGRISPEKKRLLEVSKQALELGIKQALPGNTINDIGRAIQDYVEKNGFSVVRDMVGHGVGYDVHEDPQIPHFRIGKGMGSVRLRPGMVIAIEPMVNAGTYQIRELDDQMTYATADGQLSAQFEHTVAILEKGNEVMTRI